MKMKKIFTGFFAAFVLFLSLIVGASFYVSSLLTEEFIVHQLESLFNARFQLKRFYFSILSGGDLEVEGLAVGKRDRFANKAVPLNKRPALRRKALSMEKLDVHLDFFKLLSGLVYVEGFVFKKPQVNITLYKNGSNNLSPLFTTPAIIRGKPNPAYKPSKPKKEEKEQKKKTKKDSAPLQAQSIPLSASLEKIGIENGHIKFTLAKTGDTLVIEKLNFLVKNIEFDPEDLKNKNSADVIFDMNLRLFTKANKETGLFIFSSKGKVVPFNKRTGRIDPNVVYELFIAENSYVAGFSVLEKLSGKIDLLKKAGVSLDKLREKAVLTSGTSTKVRYKRGTLTILNDMKIITKNFELLAKKGASFRLAKMTHRIDGKLTASAELSKSAVAKIDTVIQKQLRLKKKEAEKLRKKHFSSVIDDGRIFFSFVSSASITNPNIVIKNSLPSLSSLAKEAGQQYLDKEKKKLEKKAKKKAEEELKKQGDKLLKKLF